ncbi:MAG: hypothetical protein ACREC6_03960 [Hyphomicrobiaceae bacterium]
MTKSNRLLMLAMATMLVGGTAAYLLVSKQSSSFVVSRDWTALEPTLVLAVERADRAARDRLQSDLEAWKDGVMRRVDTEFLDWYFAYLRTRWADIKWVGRWIWGLGDRELADRHHFEELVAAFSERVVSSQQIQADLEKIIRRATGDFTATLSAAVMDYRSGAGVDPAILDAQLQTVIFHEDTGKTKISLKDLAAQSAASVSANAWVEQWFQRELAAPASHPGHKADVQKIGATIVAAVNAGVNAGSFAMTAAGAFGLEKATAAAIGTTACAVVIVAVIGVQDWWAHEKFVEANRQKFRDHIESTLKTFTTTTLHADGRLGITLNALKTHMISTIRKRSRGERV